jgi:hypothetical protein
MNDPRVTCYTCVDLRSLDALQIGFNYGRQFGVISDDLEGPTSGAVEFLEDLNKQQRWVLDPATRGKVFQASSSTFRYTSSIWRDF